MNTAGSVRSLVAFLKGCMTMMHQVPKIGLASSFVRDHQLIFASLRNTFRSLISCESTEVIEEMVDLNIASLIAKDWLSDTTSIPLPLADAGNILLVESEIFIIR